MTTNPVSSTSPTDLSPATARGPAMTLAAGGALFAVGGLLHPSGPWSEQLVDLTWIPAHAILLLGAVAVSVALFLLASRLTLPPRVRTATRVAAVGVALGAAEMVPHLLAFTDAHAVAHGGPTPLLDIHMQAGLLTNLVLGLSLATLAVLASRTRALGTGPAVAALAVIGGIAFAAAAPMIVATGVDAFAILFSGSVLIGLWLLISGVALARR